MAIHGFESPSRPIVHSFTDCSWASLGSEGRYNNAMAYSERAKAMRRCMGIRKDGEKCRAWACWDGKQGQLCSAHSGRTHRGPQATLRELQARPVYRAPVPACRCLAYNWPHRPGGGLCRWPELPLGRSSTPSGKRSGRMRAREKQYIFALFGLA